MGERAQRVLAKFEAMARGDLEAVVSDAAVDFEFVNPAYALEPGTRRGPGGARTAFENMLDAFEHPGWKIERVEEEGDVVVVTGTWSGRGKASGAEFENEPFGVVVTFRGDQMVRYEWFNRAEEALAAIRSA